MWGNKIFNESGGGKNKHEDVFVGTSSCAELCVGCISFHLYKRRAIFTGGVGGPGKKGKPTVPPGGTTWVKNLHPLRKDHELAHALDQSLVSRCSSVLTDASESKVWDCGFPGVEVVESSQWEELGGEWEVFGLFIWQKSLVESSNYAEKSCRLSLDSATDGATGVEVLGAFWAIISSTKTFQFHIASRCVWRQYPSTMWIAR